MLEHLPQASLEHFIEERVDVAVGAVFASPEGKALRKNRNANNGRNDTAARQGLTRKGGSLSYGGGTRWSSGIGIR